MRMSLASAGVSLQMRVVGAKGLGWGTDFGNGFGLPGFREVLTLATVAAMSPSMEGK